MSEKVDKNTGEVFEKPPSGQPKGNPRPVYFNGKNVARKVTHPECNERMAKQEFRKEADINHIMDRYKATGLLPQQVQGVQGHFANFATVDDYYTSCINAANAQKAFDLLPAKLRKIFDNDPGKLVQFVSNPKNKYAAAKMGLLTPEATQRVRQEAINAKKAADEKAAKAGKPADKTKVQKPSQTDSD